MPIFFDTETTNLYNFKKPPTHPSQPHLVQFACILDDGEGKILEQYDTIIDTGEVEIPLGATAIHGITTARAKLEGVPLEAVLKVFNKLCKHSKLLVAHNISFDVKVMHSAYSRAKRPSEFGKLVQYCTMQSSTDLLKLPGRYGYKWPKLDEAYRVLVDPEGFEGAHDAMEDVKACRAVYYKLKELGR